MGVRVGVSVSVDRHEASQAQVQAVCREKYWEIGTGGHVAGGASMVGADSSSPSCTLSQNNTLLDRNTEAQLDAGR